MNRGYESLRRGLVGAWCPSLGDSGYLVRDRSGRGMHLIAGSASEQQFWVASGAGVAMAFNGTAVNAPATSSGRGFPSGGQSRTLAGWVYPIAGGTGFTEFLAIAATSGQQFRLINDPAGSNFAFGDSINLANNLTWPAGQLPVLARWDHVAITLQSNAYAVYRNGVVARSGTFGVAINTGSVTAIRVGVATQGTINGYVDDVRIYNRALTPAEILLLASRRGIGLVPQRQRRTSASSKRLYLQVGGAWKETVPYVNAGGVWKEAAVYRHDGTAFRN